MSPEENQGIFRERKWNHKNVLLLIIVIAAILTVTILVIWFSKAENSRELATDFSLVDIDGHNFTLSENGGRIILLNFMATWCPGCIAEIPELISLWDEYKEEINVVSIDVDPFGTDEQLASFRQNYVGASWIWTMGTQSISELYDVTRIPKTVIIDKDLRIHSTYLGVVNHDALVADVKALLG